jgi:hypothetical protein
MEILQLLLSPQTMKSPDGSMLCQSSPHGPLLIALVAAKLQRTFYDLKK